MEVTKESLMRDNTKLMRDNSMLMDENTKLIEETKMLNKFIVNLDIENYALKQTLEELGERLNEIRRERGQDEQ